MISHFISSYPYTVSCCVCSNFQGFKFHDNFTLQTRHMPAAGQCMLGAFACGVCNLRNILVYIAMCSLVMSPYDVTYL